MTRSLQPHLRVASGDIAGYVLVPGDPKRVTLMAEHLDDPEKVGENRQFVSVTGYYRETRVSVVSSGIGVPAMLITIEELAKVGAHTFIRVGTTGGLKQDVLVGDMVVATGAVRTDGGTQAYVDLGYPALASWRVVEALSRSCKVAGVRFHEGIVWTSEAYYAESKERARKWLEANVVSVEMECSGLFVLASMKGLSSGAILVADGNLLYGTKKGESDESGEAYDPHVVESIHKATDVTLSAVHAIEKSSGGA
jgi:uridine phosphorylase